MNLKNGVQIAVLCCCFAASLRASTLLTYWNFNNTSATFSSPNFGSFSTSAATYGEQCSTVTLEDSSTAYRIYSNTDNGTIFNSSSVYIQLSGISGIQNGGSSAASCWGAYSSSTINKVSGDATTESGSLAVFGSVNSGKYITFALSSLGYQDLVVSYAMRTNNVAEAQQSWHYSTNGEDWTYMTSFTNSGGSFVLCTFNLPSDVANLETFYLKMVYDNSGKSVTTAIDNFQLTATAIPEPSAVVIITLGLLIVFSIHCRVTYANTVSGDSLKLS